MMRIVFERPPMFDEIDAKFRIAGKPILFSWGELLYNPMRISVPAHLIVHEEMHGWRQGQCVSIEAWWKRYIDSPSFRLEEEILAHQAEYRSLLRRGGNRNARRRHLKQTARRLAAPLYGRMISPSRAQALLREAAIWRHA